MARDFRNYKYQLSTLDWSVLGLEVTFKLLWVFLQYLDLACLSSPVGIPVRIHPWSLSSPTECHDYLVTGRHCCRRLISSKWTKQLYQGEFLPLGLCFYLGCRDEAWLSWMLCQWQLTLDYNLLIKILFYIFDYLHSEGGETLEQVA